MTFTQPPAGAELPTYEPPDEEDRLPGAPPDGAGVLSPAPPGAWLPGRAGDLRAGRVTVPA